MNEKRVDDYLALPYRVQITRSGDGYFAKVPELPGCMAWADTLDELEAMVEDAKAAWLEDALCDADPIPEPGGRTEEVIG